ncbi:hypothetical protein FRC11_004091 [Ceratobasidium sp. 423]|nr:hypothetical protein FRC11_004091 [Ceratobasidium sp. 423]
MRGALPTTREVYQPSGTLEPPPFPLPTDPQHPTSGYNTKVKYTCKKCGLDDWSSSSALDLHKREYCGKFEKPNNCVTCGKSFKQRTALVTHENIHNGSRPHPCHSCYKTFSDPSSRARHERELHNPSFGFKCVRPGCNESFKRKNMFATHMINAHTWPKEMTIPPSVYEAAKSKCARDYAEFQEKKTSEVELTDREPETFKDNESDGEKPLFNGKRPRSDSSSSDDHLDPPPAKKQALDPSPSRRNAVYSIEIPTPRPIGTPHSGHERSDSDDCSTPTGSSLPEAFSGAYQPAGHRFTTNPPPGPPLNSDEAYQNAVLRVSNRLQPYSQSTSMGFPMHSGGGGYTIAPANISPHAPVAMPEPLSYSYSSPSADGFTGSSWHTGNNSYTQWTPGSEVAQTPHVVNPAHMEHEGFPARGTLPLNPSGQFRNGHDNSLRLFPSGQQAEHSCGSSSLDPHLGHAGGSFRGHQELTRSPSEHSNSSHPDSHMSRGTFELDGLNYGYYPNHNPQVVPRSVIGPGSDGAHKRSYN